MRKARMMRCPGTGHDDCKKCVSKRAHKGDSNCTGDHGDLCKSCRGVSCIPVTKRKVPSDKEMLKIAVKALAEIKNKEWEDGRLWRLF
jgi:hypothetical protein